MPKQIILEDLPLEKRREALERSQLQRMMRFYKEGEIFKYRLTVEGYSHVESVKSNFKIISIYELIYVKHEEEDKLYRFSLSELSYKIDKYDDPVVAQIIEMSNYVSSIYQHLDFGVDKYGNMKKIYNRQEINKKWEKTKEYLTYKHPLTSYEIIKTKEKELREPKMEIMNLSFMHFLQVYFKQFGRFAEQQQFDTLHMDQFGTGIPFGLDIVFEKCEPKEEGKIHRKMKGEMIPDSAIERELLKFTKQPASGNVVYDTRADYYSDGWILEEVNFSYEEKIGEGYDMYNYIHLELIKDEENHG